jgi:beta-carotene 3-hydroxylase
VTGLPALAVWSASGLAALIAMEFWAGLLHRHVWHGPLWFLHRSHHEPRTGRFEANDALSSLHAPIAVALILYGCVGAPSVARELAYGWGLGMTAFGLLYMTFHDGLMHGRLPVAWLGRFATFRMLCDAHELHHRKNGGPYGFFLVPRKLRARLASGRALTQQEQNARGDQLLG